MLSDQAPTEDHDPVIASYPVYLTNLQAPSSNSSADSPLVAARKLFLLQYPAYRPADTPYNARNLQKPTLLRIKPSTGLLELDVPIDTKLNYNKEKGSKYAASLKHSRVAQEGGTHGLSGGFNPGPVGKTSLENEDVDMKNIPAHSSLPNDDSEPTLAVQVLGGKVVTPSPGDPIYLLGSFHNSTLHLSHLSALVQVRPQLPHLDASDELDRNRNAAFARGAAVKGKDGVALNGEIPASAAPPAAGHPPRPESKAIDIKLKSSAGGTSTYDNDLGTNTNAKLLRAIQQEPWQTYSWIDEDEVESHHHAQEALHYPIPPPLNHNILDASPKMPVDLQSAITNSEWLDLMSAPRIEHGKKGGDKGLMEKVRGRERERLRRKRNEAARRGAGVAVTAGTTAARAGGEAEVGPAGESAGKRNATREGDGTTAAEDTADDDHDGRNGPSDEESSEDDHGHDDDGDGGVSVREVEMGDVPNMPQVDGAGVDDDDDDEEVMEVQRPNSAATGGRRRGRPRKTQTAADPILVDD